MKMCTDLPSLDERSTPHGIGINLCQADRQKLVTGFEV